MIRAVLGSRPVMRIAVSLATIALTPTGVLAQRPDVPAFEVASVRVSPPEGPRSQRMTDARVDLVNIPLRSVLQIAFRANSYDLVGPEWLTETRVTIQATMPAGTTRQQVPEMLQRLLAERFGLIVHREPREMDMHELSVGVGGHKMREVDTINELDKTFPVNRIAERLGTATAMDRIVETPGGTVRTVTGEDLGVTTVTATSMYKLTLNVDRAGRRTQTLDATRMTMADLAGVLTTNIGQPVLDRTKLSGTYEFGGVELPMDAAIIQTLISASRTAGFSPPELPNVSVPRALEPLGLRLERRRAPIDVIVVDSIKRTPTNN